MQPGSEERKVLVERKTAFLWNETPGIRRSLKNGSIELDARLGKSRKSESELNGENPHTLRARLL